MAERMIERFRVGILGATGAVGQKFVELLAGHPWFTITAVVASDRSAGKPYREAVAWMGGSAIPGEVASLTVKTSSESVDCDFVFSGLDATVATEIETDYASRGLPVISNAKNYRMDPAVPLLIPEVNPEHISLIEKQTWPHGGFIVTNPNCATVGLVSAIKPLHDAFGLEALHVTTMQALSGAGYPGVPSLDIQGNVLPFIEGEEEKVAMEPLKLLGSISNGEVAELEIPISVQCNRVPVVDGHLLSISVRLERSAKHEDIVSALQGFTASIDGLNLPSAPERFIQYFDDDRYPQPARHAMLGNGMTVSVGRLRPCAVLDFRFVTLVHNTIRGAAGGAILNAELLVSRGYISNSGI